jgi:putative PIN family toxin of toxin-antitoxin system
MAIFTDGWYLFVVICGIISNTMKSVPRIIIDTNVLVSALRSSAGWSFDLLTKVGAGHFEHVVTVPLVMEYEDMFHRPGMVKVSAREVDDILDYVCASALRTQVHFLWRPKLADIKDDMVLEAAVNGQCQYIVTWNVRDFAAAADFGIQVISPDVFLKLKKEVKP